MNPELILQMIALAESLYSMAAGEYVVIKADLAMTDQKKIEAALATSGDNMHAARLQLDADAA